MKLLENLAASCTAPGGWLVAGVCRTWCGMPCYTAETSKPCRDPGCRKIAQDRLRSRDDGRWLERSGSLVSSERALGEAVRIGVCGVEMVEPGRRRSFIPVRGAEYASVWQMRRAVTVLDDAAPWAEKVVRFVAQV
jgi:hypothetical protein